MKPSQQASWPQAWRQKRWTSVKDVPAAERIRFLYTPETTSWNSVFSKVLTPAVVNSCPGKEEEEKENMPNGALQHELLDRVRWQETDAELPLWALVRSNFWPRWGQILISHNAKIMGKSMSEKLVARGNQWGKTMHFDASHIKCLHLVWFCTLQWENMGLKHFIV